MKPEDIAVLVQSLEKHANEEKVREILALIRDLSFSGENDSQILLKSTIVFYRLYKFLFHQETQSNSHADFFPQYNQFKDKWEKSFDSPEDAIRFLLYGKREFEEKFSFSDRDECALIIALSKPGYAKVYLKRNGLIVFFDQEAIKNLIKFLNQYHNNKDVFCQENLAPLIRRAKESTAFGGPFIELITKYKIEILPEDLQYIEDNIGFRQAKEVK